MLSRTAVALLLTLTALPVRADFIDWWLTPDQQGRYYYAKGEYAKAARAFTQPRWKALAFYAAADYASAAALFATLEDASGYFYLGNALARQEQLTEAVAAYQQALALQPEFPAAEFNLDWVQGLLQLDQQEYEDAGGTGGKLGADRVVFSERAEQAVQTATTQELQAEGLSEQQLQDMWMRRVQTTPGDFLRLKFIYQRQQGESTVDDSTAGTSTIGGDTAQ
ncbi:MAG: tetratricopeptide repeat protein [Gammaproteobacteria bacterium]